jgi:hypothetical protein
MFVWLVADGWCWFVLREKYCWLVADKPSEQGNICVIEMDPNELTNVLIFFFW